ncbi:MAG: EthD domain-containing protein [Deltaproteobacteria bacterium]|nr:EthD domain-containing protein [Deltaproteobacteria bacterium]
MRQKITALRHRLFFLFFVLLLSLQPASAAARDDRLVYVMYPKPGMMRSQFQQYWKNKHALLVQKYAVTLGISACTQQHILPVPFNLIMRLWRKTIEAPAGIAVWQIDADVLSASLATEAGAQAMDALIEDEATFVNFSRSSIWVAREHKIVEGGPPPQENAGLEKVVWAGHGLPQYTPEEFQYHYLNTIGPVVQEYAASIGIDNYIQAHAVDSPLNAVLRDARGTAAAFSVQAALLWDFGAVFSSGTSPEVLEGLVEIPRLESEYIDFPNSFVARAVEYIVFSEALSD